MSKLQSARVVPAVARWSCHASCYIMLILRLHDTMLLVKLLLRYHFFTLFNPTTYTIQLVKFRLRYICCIPPHGVIYPLATFVDFQTCLVKSVSI